MGQLVVSGRRATDILTEQNNDRLAELVPLRFARMLTDPFSFYRGAAAVMAADLAGSPSSGIEVMSCGDAHLANFGVSPGPQRSVLIDLNDFDETGTAPFEWDLKRLLTSVIVAARHVGHPERAIRAAAADVTGAYQAALSTMLTMNTLDRFALREDPQRYPDPKPVDPTGSAAANAAVATPEQLLARLTESGPDGRPRFRDNPPILQHLDEAEQGALTAAFEDYRTRAPAEVATLLSQFAVADLARRVVGVGSVGTRCYLLLLTAVDRSALILQIKQAGRSVLDKFGQRRQPDSMTAAERAAGHGARVVAGQRILQPVPDPFLGTLRGGDADYYLRRYRRTKNAFDPAAMSAKVLGDYAAACASALARAHSQSPAAEVLGDYIGAGDAVGAAITDWSYAYADITLQDYHLLQAAAAAGEIAVAESPLR